MFDPDKLTREVEELKNVLENITTRLQNLENAVFAAAGTGPAQEAGTIANDLQPQTINVKAGDVGSYEGAAHDTGTDPAPGQ